MLFFRKINGQLLSYFGVIGFFFSLQGEEGVPVVSMVKTKEEEVTSVSVSKSREEVIQTILEWNVKATTAYKEGRCEDALLSANEAIRLAKSEALWGKENMNLYALYFNRANILKKLSRFKEARRDYEAALSVLLFHKSSNVWNIIFMHINIAGTFFEEKNYEESLVWFEKGEKFMKQYFVTPTPEHLNFYSEYANACYMGGQKEKGIEIWEKMIKIASKFEKNVAPKLLFETYKKLGSTCYQVQKYQKGIDYLTLVLESEKYKKMAIDKEELRTLKGFLACCYLGTKRYDEAVLRFEVLLNEVEGEGKKEDLERAFFYDCLGQCFQEQEKTEKALFYYENLEYPIRLKYEEKSWATYLMYSRLYTLYGKRNNFPRKLIYVKKAIDVLESLATDKEPLCQKVLSDNYFVLADTYLVLRSGQRALASIERSLKAWHRWKPKDSGSYAPIYNMIGNAFFLLQEHDEAIGYYEKAYILSKMALGKEDALTQVIHKNLQFAKEQMQKKKASSSKNRGKAIAD